MEDLLLSLGEFFARDVRAHRPAACCTVITGPSRTADIELTSPSASTARAW